MKQERQKRLSGLSFFVLLVFLVVTEGCSTKYAWYNPVKDNLALKQNVFDCEEKAAAYSKNMGKAGKQKIVDQHMTECMEALGYKLVPEKSIPKKEDQEDLALTAGANQDDVEKKMINSTYCTAAVADWCGDCWNNPANEWCCTYRKSKTKQNPDPKPDCVPKNDTSKWKYCEGCNTPVGGAIYDFCAKPPKGMGGPTNIRITNKTKKDVNIAFVTGAEGEKGSGACQDSAKMISYDWIAKNTNWCKNPTHLGGGVNAGHCTGIVLAGGSVDVKRPETGEDALKCLTGSIHLGGYSSCPDPNGFTQGEFTFNPTHTDTEAVDISLVNGVNYSMTINLPGDAWKVQYRGDKVQTIGPSAGLKGNNNKPGIFPPGCTDCILAVTGKIPCPKITPNPQCQKERLCNVQRSWTGGAVEFMISDLPAFED